MKLWNSKPLAPLGESITEIRAWFNTDLGQELLAAEKRVLDRVMPSMFGYHMVQIGVHAETDLLSEAAGGHKFMLLPRIELGMGTNTVVADAEVLPLASECIDTVVLHHALDFAQSPHQLLREASRILRPGGKLVILGFNPYSFWGLSRLYRQRRGGVPWRGHFLSAGRLLDWLTLLELKRDRICSGFYRPPLEQSGWRRRLEFVERWGERYHTNNGAFVVVIASKETYSATPIGRSWRRRLAFPVVKSATSRAGHQAARECSASSTSASESE